MMMRQSQNESVESAVREYESYWEIKTQMCLNEDECCPHCGRTIPDGTCDYCRGNYDVLAY